MRLIDRDLLLSEIEKSREKNPHKDSKIRANHTIEHDHIAHLVLEQPTAYNVDKVVEHVREFHGICNKCLNNKNSIATCSTFCDIGRELATIKSGCIE